MKREIIHDKRLSDLNYKVIACFDKEDEYDIFNQ
jgi:hypothetical protein